MKINKYLVFFIGVIILLVPFSAGYAQTEPEMPYYVVQSGDSLSVIAVRFGTTVQEILEINEIEDPNAISVGTIIQIPGLEGVEGELILQTVNLGDSYASFTKRNGFPEELLQKLNRLTSPTELYIGSRIIIPKVAGEEQLTPIDHMRANLTTTEISIENGLNPWSIRLDPLTGSYRSLVPGEVIYSTITPHQQMQVYPGLLSLSIEPLPLIQGKTFIMRFQSAEPLNIEGKLAGMTLRFFKLSDYEYVALQGIHARHPTGVADIFLRGITAGGEEIVIEQKLIVESGYFGQDPPITVDPKTIQSDVIEPEQAMVEEITGVVTPERYWNDVFRYPVDEPCLSGNFGGSRIYNGTYHYYHTGIDFSVCSANNLNIYAVAPGVVVYSGALIVRGNAVIIDHGWGVYSGYWHQSENAVKTGDVVEAGQVIGQIGNTGRSTGPHIHLEIWVNGIQVDPMDWLLKKFP